MDTSREIVVVTGRWIILSWLSTHVARADVERKLRRSCSGFAVYKKGIALSLCYFMYVVYFFISLSVLLGFGPFRQYVVNPSWEAAKVQQSHF